MATKAQTKIADVGVKVAAPERQIITGHQLKDGMWVKALGNAYQEKYHGDFMPSSCIVEGEVGIVTTGRSCYIGNARTTRPIVQVGRTMWSGKSAANVWVVNLDTQFEVLPTTGPHASKYFENVRTSLGTGVGTTQGSDPEVFVVDKNGVVIPAWTFLPRQAEAGVTAGGANAYWDGFQAEMGVYVGTCHENMMSYIRRGLLLVRNAALKVNKDARLTSQSVLEVPRNVMASVSDEHAALGCAPSMNAYGARKLDVDGRDLLLRFAGCHMHFGFGTLTPEQATSIVKACDQIYGVASVSMLEGVEDVRRRAYYGRAGEYRLPAHGLEYRTPGSGTLMSPLVAFVSFDLCRFASELGKRNAVEWTLKDDDRVQHIINEYDVTEARKVLRENETTLKAMLRGMYFDHSPYALNLIMKGAKEFQPIDDMQRTWYLDKAPEYGWQQMPASKVATWMGEVYR